MICFTCPNPAPILIKNMISWGHKNMLYLPLCPQVFGSAWHRGDTQAVFDGLDLTIKLSTGQAHQECCRGTLGNRSEATGSNPTI